VANPYFGNLADVWKHAVLVEVLQREPPGWYAETHAGSGAYAVVRDAEREFGILRFLQVAPRFAVLARSRYRAVAARYVESHSLYPGSALLAMSVLGDDGSYLLCDLDRESVSDLRRWSRELGVHDCEIAEADGMTAVAARLDGGSPGPGLVHIDPFNPDTPGPGGYVGLIRSGPTFASTNATRPGSRQANTSRMMPNADGAGARQPPVPVTVTSPHHSGTLVMAASCSRSRLCAPPYQ
jgi:hypothetical protein